MIRVGDLYISPADFVDIVDEIKKVVESESPYGKPTASELFFVIALIYFKREKCEWAVIEAGIGGRYDATNAIEHPKATVITNIDLDHTKILGKTYESIASDKSGIIKKGSLFFTGEKKKKIISLFKKVCGEVGATFHAVPLQGSAYEHGETLAHTVCASLGVSKKVLSKIEKVYLPCRFEQVSFSPAVILDGAHNRIKMQSVRKNLSNIKYKKLHLIFSTGSITEDSIRMLPEIIPLADSIVIAGSGDSKRKLANPKAVLSLVTEHAKKGIKIEIASSPAEAHDLISKNSRDADCILATGSFFLVGELRKKWFPEKWILEHRKSFK
jgi:dihydrofolate synthase/folylpolyglutamate synthase